jgi:hypothetical protein
MKKAKRSRLAAPEVCPVCGEDVPHNALACPECGADHNSGWRDDAGVYDGVDLGDEQFDYEQFVAEEFGSGPKPKHIRLIWWITAIAMLLAFLALYLYRR